MKKFLLVIAAIFSVAFYANAKVELSLDGAYFWGDGTKEGNVVTFNKEWDGLAWWLGGNTPNVVKAVVEYEEAAPMLTQWLVQFADGVADMSNQAPEGSTSLEIELPAEATINQMAIQNAAPGVIKIKSVTLYTTEDQEQGGDEPVVEGNKCVAITCAEAKANAWDTQVFINFPKALEAGKSYTLMMDVKGSEPLEGKMGQYGWEAIQPVLQDNASTNRDQWDGPADLQYMAHFCVTTEWTNTIDHEGNAIVSDGAFPYDRVLLNLGAYQGTLYIDNLRMVDQNGEIYFNYNFDSADQFQKVVSGWMNVPLAHVDSDCPTAIENVKAEQNATRCFNIAGQQLQSAKGLCIVNGKLVLVK